MESGVVAVGAAAIAYYVYSRTRRDLPTNAVETHLHVEQAPRNWTGELYLFAEALRYLYLEYITHWQTADLFIGVFYLARQGIRDFPAAQVVAHGRRLHPKSLETSHVKELKDKFEIMYRLLIYSQKLRNTSVEIPIEEWMDLELSADDFVLYRPKASVLCPAYVIVKDPLLHCFVLAVRGTHTTRDIFTSLSGAAKPHHLVDRNGPVLGYSHLGMLAGARWIFKHCKQMLLEAQEAQPDYKLLITGHSMGGGAAAMLTMMIREQLPPFHDAECYTFACPGCMTLELAQSCAPYVTTLIYGTDVVPTISPGSGDLLREEVSQSSWTIETRVKGVYRSASAWTLRQARTVSSLTTRCIRPRDKSSSHSTGNLKDVTLRELSPENGQDTAAQEDVPGEVDDVKNVQTPEETNTSRQFTWLPRPSQSPRILLSTVPPTANFLLWMMSRSVASEAAENREEDMEGVFNAKGMEDDGEGETAGATSSTSTQSNPKRLLYPAGKIYHLVPEYILKADPSLETNAEREDTEEPSSSEEEAWYHPHEQQSVLAEESAFVLFSDIPQEAYGRIRVCRSMVMDHFVPRYKTALSSTIQEFTAALEDTTVQHI